MLVAGALVVDEGIGSSDDDVPPEPVVVVPAVVVLPPHPSHAPYEPSSLQDCVPVAPFVQAQSVTSPGSQRAAADSDFELVAPCGLQAMAYQKKV